MDKPALHLALHGTLVLIVSLVAGLLLHKAIRLGRDAAPWHLAHAGGSGRGVMLLALSGIVPFVALSPAQVWAFVWLILAFTWTSTAAMVVAAATGARGVTWRGSAVSRLVFVLYVASAVTVFPAAFLLLAGLISALTSTG